MTEEQNKEAARAILANEHEVWKTKTCTKHLVEILDRREKKFQEWLESNAATATTDELRCYISQLREIKLMKRFLVETTTFVKEIIK